MISVSVIIPNYNHAAFLEQRIRSVLDQTFTDFEMIILDDASDDNSRDIIERYQSNLKVSHILYNYKNSGSPFKQWQKGINLAQGEWIWIAESDDVADPEFLRSAFETLQASDASACYCDSFEIDENNKILNKISDVKNKFFKTQKWAHSYEENGIKELNEYLKFLCTINNASSLIFKKELFKRAEDRITGFRYYGDWFFYINTALQTNICYNRKTLCSFRNHAYNLINDDIPIVESRKEYFLLLQFLLGLSQVSDKEKLIRFFCLNYLGWGWTKHSPVKGLSILLSFFKLDKKLALIVTPKIIWYKISGKKNRRLYS